MDFPSAIVLKQGMLVEIIRGNFSTDDGLVNGAEGIFRECTNYKLDIVWIEFTSPLTSTLQWGKMHKHFVQNIQCTWKPIIRISRQMTFKNKRHILQQQFPVRLACAHTIHRS